MRIAQSADARQIGTRVLTPSTSLLPSAGASAIITQYEIDLTTGDVLINGTFGRITALNDEPIVGTDAWLKSFKLDGSAATVLSADGKTYWCALVIGLVSGVATLFAVFGAEANDGAEVAVSQAQVLAALEASDYANLDTTALLVVGRIKIKRVATDTITYTVTAPASNAALEAERQAEPILS